MPRNLDHRIEVVVPVEDARVRAELGTLDTLLADNVQAWPLGPDGTWERLRPGKGERLRSTHRDSDAAIGQRGRRRPASGGPVTDRSALGTAVSKPTPSVHRTLPVLHQPVSGPADPRGSIHRCGSRHRHRLEHCPPSRRRTHAGSDHGVHEQRAVLALGDEIEQFGRISDLKLREAAEHARAYARIARELGCRLIDVIVTAPGRQSENAGAPIRARAGDRRWFGCCPRGGGQAGLLGCGAAGELPGALVVCDVGGGSTEIVAGTTPVGRRSVVDSRSALCASPAASWRRPAWEEGGGGAP